MSSTKNSTTAARAVKLSGNVGALEIQWLDVPRGPEGRARAIVGGREVMVGWRRDSDGLWLEMPDGLYGFDLEGALDDAGHVEFKVRERGSERQWQGAAFRRAGETAAAAETSGKRKALRIRAQMPGKITRILVQAGQEVENGQALLVMEAMKMENEIRAPQAGRLQSVLVSEGQAVDSGADLMKLE